MAPPHRDIPLASDEMKCMRLGLHLDSTNCQRQVTNLLVENDKSESKELVVCLNLIDAIMHSAKYVPVGHVFINDVDFQKIVVADSISLSPIATCTAAIIFAVVAKE